MAPSSSPSPPRPVLGPDAWEEGVHASSVQQSRRMHSCYSPSSFLVTPGYLYIPARGPRSR